MRGTPTNSFGWDFMLTWGAKYNPSIYAGEWWRWVTSLLLHQNFNHILSNLVSARGVGMTADRECTVAGLNTITACMVLMAVSPSCKSSHKATSTCWWPSHFQPLLVFALPCTTCQMNLVQFVPPLFLMHILHPLCPQVLFVFLSGIMEHEYGTLLVFGVFIISGRQLVS